ncbi:MAG: LysM peptidoglycan-binding domain-containing protein [Verrucomicrobiota bacterium]
MRFLVRWMAGVLAVALLLGAGGCMPSSDSQMEEEKESHFLAGKSCTMGRDYRGAIEEFEKALEVNPHSASAHFQLGWLYEEKDPDPAAAIYHYQQFLKLRPNYENAEVIRQHINNCRQDLAKAVLPLPVSPGMQHEFEQLAEENKRLRGELEQWKQYAARLATNSAPAPAVRAATPVSEPAPVAVTSGTASGAASAVEARAAAAPAGRTYTVKAGDSPIAIARRNGVKLDALLAANPGLDPKRLRVGQTLNLPPP